MKLKAISFTKRWILAVLLFIGIGIDSNASTLIDGLYYELISSSKTATVTYQSTSTTNYSGLKDVVIPETVVYNGVTYTVVEIADKAFANCTSLESISIPATVIKIGDTNNYYDTTNDSSVDYYQKAGDKLPFYNCTSLKSVRFEDGATSITLGVGYVGYYYDSYYYNSRLMSSDYYKYSKGLFYYCPLEEVYLGRNINYANYIHPKETGVESSFSGHPFYYGYSAFYNQSKLKKVTIGDKVTEMPQYVFTNCKSLSFVEFGKNLASISINAFAGCSALTSVMLDSNTNIIFSSAFYDCTSLQTVSMPGVTSIGASAFYQDTNLSALELSPNLSSISDLAFNSTRKLASISLPNTLKTIGNSAFANSGLKEITIPSSVTLIGGGCFSGSSIQSAYFGDKNTTLESNVFAGCTELESVTIGSGQLDISESCFDGCTKLKNITLNAGLVTIADKAFANCTSLESISIPATVIKIGDTNNYYDTTSYSSVDYYQKAGDKLPFYNCTSLKSVRFEDGATSITLGVGYVGYYYDSYIYNSRLMSSDYYKYSKGLFYYCPLEEVYLGRNINYANYIHPKETGGESSFSGHPFYYGCSAFYNQSKLKKVTIGENVTSLPQYVFYGCSNISSIISVSKDPASVGSNGFANYNATLYYPNGASTYTTSSPWSNFTKIYAMLSEGNLIFIPTSDTEAMVAKYPGTSPESISIPASVNSNGKTLAVTKVMEGSFAACENLTNVSFPSSVTEIGEGAFARNEKLASITFNGQKIIGKNAFSGCTSITTLTLPSTLEEISERAFFNIPSLTQVSFGSSLKTIGKEAFASCRSLTAARMPNTLKTIETSAFENCVKLTYATVGNSLQRLGNRAFFNCNVLTEIEIPGSTLSIGDQSFENCGNLALAILNSGTKTIGANCFKNCGNLTTMSIPGTVTTIGEGAFDDCTMLSSLSFLAGEEELWIPYFTDSPIRTLRIGRNLKYTYGETGSPFRNKSSITRVSFTGNYVTNLYNNLFDGCSGITSIELPTTLKTINSYAFHNCTGITEIIIPEGVTSIGVNGFENCVSLSNVSLPTTLVDIQDYLFHNCTNLQSIELKEGLTAINTHAFDNCTSLEGLTIPGTIKNIDSYVFEGCKSFSNLTFTDSDEKISLNATKSLFRDCPLTTLYIGRNINYDYETSSNTPFYEKEQLKEVTFSENEKLTTILPYFIYGANSLPSLVVPDNITSAGKYAFANCNAMESIQLSNSLQSIEEGLLKNCSSLKALTIPGSVKSVNDYALGGCLSLTDLYINDTDETMTANKSASSKGMCAEAPLENLYIGRNITYIADSSNGYSPFYGLSSLKTVIFNMAGNINNLGDYYFGKCSSVKNLDLPQSIVSIGQYGLSDMSSLENLTFPQKVSVLRNNLMDGCRTLPNFTVYKAVTSIEENVFNGCGSLANVNFENGSDNLQIARKYVSNSYSSLFADCPIETLHLGRWLIYEIGNESWSPFYSQTRLVNLTLGKTVGDIGKFLFEKCSALEKVEIPGVESIGEKSFYECSKLKDVAFNTGTKSLGDYAFSECVALDNVKLPATVVSISDGCFMNCRALSTVDMGHSLEIIGPSAFLGCNNLMNADIPETVYGLGVESFKGCTSLPYINVPKGISSVGARAFQGCTGAEWVTLSERCTSMGASSFDGCTSIRYIKSFNGNPPVGLPSFPQNVIDNATVFVPEDAVEDYQDADAWWEFFYIRSMNDGKFVTHVNLDVHESTLKATQTLQLTAEVGPDDATDTSVGFLSDNLDVAVVDASGLVTAVSVGEANIKAYAKDGSGYYEICKVTVIPTLVERIDLSQQEMSLRVNRTGQITAEIYPATTTNKEITWTSSNNGVATIDEDGNITAVYDGVTTLKAEANDGSGIIATCQLTVLPPMAGDSNDNDAVTISDAVNTANYAVGNDVENFNFRAADVNGDSRITLADASGTVSIILEQPVEDSVALMKAKGLIVENDADFLVMEDFSVKVGQPVTVPVMLDNTVDYVALQADITVPEGMKIVSVTIGNRAESNHSLITKRIDDKTVRVVLFDLNNSEFADNNEPLFNINIISDEARDGEIIIGNILASDAEAHEYSLYSTGGNFSDMTGVDNAYISDIRIETAENAINVFNAENNEVAVFATDGTTITRFVAKTNIETIKVVPGIYVVSAGDIAVKVYVK